MTPHMLLTVMGAFFPVVVSLVKSRKYLYALVQMKKKNETKKCFL